MKMVVAYIRHEAFEPIRTELLELGFPSLSISEVKGSGRQKGITERYRGAELTNYLRLKVKIECVVADGDGYRGRLGGELRHAREPFASEHRVHHLQVDGPEALDEPGSGRMLLGPVGRQGRLRHGYGAAAAAASGWAWSVSSPASPVRIRYACSTGMTNTLPSPTAPVRACLRTVSTIVGTSPSATTHSIFTLGRR